MYILNQYVYTFIYLSYINIRNILLFFIILITLGYLSIIFLIKAV